MVKKIIVLILAALLVTGCGTSSAEPDSGESEQPSSYDTATQENAENPSDEAAEAMQVIAAQTDSNLYAATMEDETIKDDDSIINVSGESESVSDLNIQNASDETLTFVDVFGEQYETVINPNVPKHNYSAENFSRNGDGVSYDDEEYSSRFGVDVSRHQGKINWEKLKSEGVEFAFIRIGYRGYGSAGNINIDERFYENIKGAQSAGIDVGVYFFSQAINENEALEEAESVLKWLEGYELQLPVVYDPESILDAPARTDDVSGEQFTNNTIVFCDTIREHGYEPMIYSNMLWEAFEYDLSQLTEIPIWYADYEDYPQTPYYYSFWQYTNEGRISGIDGEADFDIQIFKKELGLTK